MKNKVAVFVIVLCYFRLTAFGQEEAQFKASVNRDTILKGNYLKVTFTLEGTTIREFTPPIFEDFKLVNGPSTFTNIMTINGEVKQKTSYTYCLEPKKLGKLTIPEALVTTEAGFFHSNPIVVYSLANPTGQIQEEQVEEEKDSIQDLFFNLGDFYRTMPSTPQKEEEEERTPKQKKKRKLSKI